MVLRVKTPVNEQFGVLIVVSDAPRRITKAGRTLRMVLCRCSICEKEHEYVLGAIKSRAYKSCSTKCSGHWTKNIKPTIKD